MKTTTPKRKRGQHAKRHPWSNAVGPMQTAEEAKPFEALMEWVRSVNSISGYHGLTDKEKLRLHGAFMAGYRAGKEDAK